MAKSKDSQDVLSLLDSLGDAPPPDQPESIEAPASTENEKELLGFLDDLAKQPTRTETPRPAAATTADARASRDLAKSIASAKMTTGKVDEKADAAASTSPKTQTTEPGSGGGWLGGLWSMGSAAMKTAEQKVKELQQSEEAKAWEEKVRDNVSVIGKFGNDLRSRTLPSLSSTLTSVLNTIAPPIERHEVLKVGVYHDMVGYPQIDQIVYDVFEKVMGQVEGGTLIVQKGREGKRRGSESRNQKRDLSICEGVDEALKLAKANVAEPSKTPTEEKSDPALPIHVSHIHLSIQPTVFNISPPITPPPPSTDGSSTPTAISPPEYNFAYVVYLFDPVHNLELNTISQGYPVEWLKWQDDQEEIADVIGEWLDQGLRLGVACVAQGYVAKRMGIGEERRREEKGKDKE